jgi:hypothetical protein
MGPLCAQFWKPCVFVATSWTWFNYGLPMWFVWGHLTGLLVIIVLCPWCGIATILAISNYSLWFSSIIVYVGSKMQLPIYMIYTNKVRKKPRSSSSYLMELSWFLEIRKVEIKELKDWNKWKELNMDYIHVISRTLLSTRNWNLAQVLNILNSKN